MQDLLQNEAHTFERPSGHIFQNTQAATQIAPSPATMPILDDEGVNTTDMSRN